MIACLGIAIGLAVGAALPFGRALRPSPAAADRADPRAARNSASRFLYGVLTALAFALAPLGPGA